MLQALVLGAVQGLTEFVPISSSGHLVLVPFLLRWQIPDLSFDVAVHLGTALALLAYFWRDLAGMLVGVVRVATRRAAAGDRERARLAGLIVVAGIPAAIAGLSLRGFFEGLFERPEVAATALLGTAVVLVSAEFTLRRRGDPGRDVDSVGVRDAIVVGLMQAFAIVPGLSRSGMTIAGGVFSGLSREAAARFSFLLAFPTIVGAGLVEARDFSTDVALGPVIGGTIAAAVFGFAAIAILLRYLRAGTLSPFALYCALLGAVALGFWFQIR